MYRRFISTLLKDARGATAVEYGLMVALIAVTIISAVFALGGGVARAFSCAAISLMTLSAVC